MEPPIQDYLDQYNRPATVKGKLTALCRFFEMVNKAEHPKPNTKIDRPKYEAWARDYLALVRADRERAIKDLTRFSNHLDTSAAWTQSGYVNTAVLWLEHHKIELSPGERKKINRRAQPRRAASQNVPLTPEIIAEILEYSTPAMRALIMVLESTGMRLGEALQITVDDLIKGEPLGINIRKEYTKTKERRVVFVGSEAEPVLDSWLKHRETYIRNKKGDRRYLTDPETDRRIFPFNDSAATEMFQNALERCGRLTWDRNVRRTEIHMHSFRKYFRTNLVKAGGNAIDMAEKLLGHRGYLSDSYVVTDDEALRTFYAGAEHFLWIKKSKPINAAELKTVQDHAAKLEAKVKALEAQMEDRKIVVAELTTGDIIALKAAIRENRI